MQQCSFIAIFIYVDEPCTIVKVSSSLLKEWETKLVQIQGVIDKERSEMAKLLSQPQNIHASTDDQIARQKIIYRHTQKLHALENQYCALESNIKTVKV
jgi:hypothetical protein